MKSQLRSFLRSPQVLLSDQFSYGMREVLLLTHGEDPTSLINAKLVHGEVDYKDASKWPSVWKSPFRRYPILSWSTVQKKYLESIGFKEKIFAVGAPFLHILKYVNENPRLRWPSFFNNSLLYFPSHSHPGHSIHGKHLVENQINFHDFKKVTVCLFWLDFINPTIRERYLRLGLDVTCVGYKGNSSIEIPWADDGGRTCHLITLANLISKYEYIVTERMSVTFLYAAAQGKKVRYLEKFTKLNVASNPIETLVLKEPCTIISEDISPGIWYDCSMQNPALDVSLKYLGQDTLNGFQDWVNGTGSLSRNKIASHYVENVESKIFEMLGI